MDEIIHTVIPLSQTDPKRTSQVWDHFGPLLQNGIPVQDNYFYCKKCVEETKILTPKYQANSATSNLSYHLSSVHHIQTTNIENAEIRTQSVMNIYHAPASSAERKSTLARRLVLMMVTDLLPFSLVTGEGFRRFAIQEKLINDVVDLPSDRSLANSALNDLYVICQNAIKNKMQSLPHVISLQLDMSTSKNRNVPLITVIVSFMDENWNLQNYTLTTQLFERPHTATAIASLVELKLAENNLSNKKIMMTGDHGKNVISSFTKINNAVHYFDCIGHSIHLVLTVDITKNASWKISAPVIKKIRKCHGKLVYQLYKLKEVFEQQQRNDIIKYLHECEDSMEAFRADEESPVFEFSDSDIQEVLLEEYQNASAVQEDFGAFKMANATRWYSSLEMMKSYKNNLAAINQLLTQTKNTDLILSTDEINILNELLILFQVFEKSLKVLQTGKEMCSNLVLMIFDEISENLHMEANEAKVISPLFRCAKDSFEKRVKIEKYFLGSAILDPGQVQLPIIGRYLAQMEKTFIGILDEISNEIQLEAQIETTQELRPSTSKQDEITAAKKVRLELLSKHGQQHRFASQNSTIIDEFPRYFTRAQVFDYASQEVTDFWQKNKDDFPILYNLARIIFAIQPMSSQAERNFSTSNSLITQKRASLNPERAHKILFLHDNLDCLLESLSKND